jgi:hypothetical protein
MDVDRGTTGPSGWRTFIASTVGVVLLGSAFGASFAGGGGGVRRDYGGGGGGGAAGIAAGAAAVGIGIAAATGALGGAAGAGAAAGAAAGAGAAGAAFPVGSPVEIAERLAVLPEGMEVTSLRVVPEQSVLNAGFCRAFLVEGKGRDGNWYSVTANGGTSLSIVEDNAVFRSLQKMEGSRNIFCVLANAPQSANGQSIVVTATFTQAGKPTLSADARVQIRVSAAGVGIGP